MSHHHAVRGLDGRVGRELFGGRNVSEVPPVRRFGVVLLREVKAVVVGLAFVGNQLATCRRRPLSRSATIMAAGSRSGPTCRSVGLTRGSLGAIEAASPYAIRVFNGADPHLQN